MGTCICWFVWGPHLGALGFALRTIKSQGSNLGVLHVLCELDTSRSFFLSL